MLCCHPKAPNSCRRRIDSVDFVLWVKMFNTGTHRKEHKIGLEEQIPPVCQELECPACANPCGSHIRKCVKWKELHRVLGLQSILGLLRAGGLRNVLECVLLAPAPSQSCSSTGTAAWTRHSFQPKERDSGAAESSIFSLPTVLTASSGNWEKHPISTVRWGCSPKS